MATSEQLIDYFFGNSARVAELDTIEISHESFSKTYRAVANNWQGIEATVEGGKTESFEYVPMQINSNETRDNLDFGVQLLFGDLGQLLPNEIRSVIEAGKMAIKPVVQFRSYRSDNLTSIMHSVKMRLHELLFTSEGAELTAGAPPLTNNRTGERYTINRFDGLKGFVNAA